MKVILIANSRLNEHSVGARVLKISDELFNRKIDVAVISRTPIQTILSGIQIYTKIPTEWLKTILFDNYVLSKIKKMDIYFPDLVIHSFNYLPRTYKYLKKQHKIVIIQDMQMSINYPTENVDWFTVPSEYTLKMLGPLSEKATIIPFGVDYNKFEPTLKNYKGIFSVAFVGNICKRKGVDTLIDAWKKTNFKNAELHLYGRVYPECLHYLIGAKKYNIFFHGMTKNIEKELPKHLLYVFMSRLEGSSKSIYEAMSCGLPVITTPNSGSVVTSGYTGYIIPADNPESLINYLTFFYNSRDVLEYMSSNARRKAEEYPWERYSKEVVELYENIIYS